MNSLLLFVSVISLFIVFILIVVPFIYYKLIKKEKKNVCILVLGDLGRSPRMQYHAISFAKEGFNVDLIGYPGSKPLEELYTHPLVTIRYLHPPPNFQSRLSQIPSYLLKVIWQTGDLLFVLFNKRPSDFVLLQNPPAIPTIPICWLYCILNFLTGTRFVIDWHNYAHTIMALSLRKNHILIKIAKLIESFFGTQADTNFCVTKAMKDDLQEKWGIKANVLYDRPPDKFAPISLEEKHNLLLKLAGKYKEFKGELPNSTKFTEVLDNGQVRLSPSRPGFIISSTSWTEDEDFSILLDALQDYEKAIENSDNSNLPDLICVITGKGPLKEFYLRIIELKKWSHVKVVTPWLENKDYPKLLASADLGVCLHTSSSGLDLPMKVVDMFGCGLPVCAHDFQCLNELVKHEVNSLVFKTKEELAEQIKAWFEGFPNNPTQRNMEKKFREALNEFQKLRWHDNWSVQVLPCFQK